MEDVVVRRSLLHVHCKDDIFDALLDGEYEAYKSFLDRVDCAISNMNTGIDESKTPHSRKPYN